MKRSTLILLAVILVLAGALVIQRVDFGGGPPSITAWEGKADTIVIKKPKKELTLSKKDESWYVSSEEYPADDTKVEGIINWVKDIGEIEVVSNAPDEYGRYELTEDKAYRVTVRSGDNVLRDLYVGKSSSVGRKAYARQSGEDRVFLVGQRLKTSLNTTVSELRDKTIVNVDRKDLQRVEIEGPQGPALQLLPEQPEQEGSASSQGETASSGDSGKKQQESSGGKQERSWIVKGASSDVSSERITSFFRTAEPLSAMSFDTGEPEGEPFVKITFVQQDGGEQTVALYSGGKPGMFPATASTVSYPFLLSESDAEALMLKLDALMPESLKQQENQAKAAGATEDS